MSYTSTTIFGLDATIPDGATENVSILDNSDREIKAVLKNQYAITTIAAPTTLGATHSIVIFGATTSATLPTASTVASSTYTKQYHFINPVGSGFTGTIVGTVSGVVNPTLAAGETMMVSTDGTTWFMHSPKYVTADGALRTHSATPAANTVPVSGSDSFLAQGWFANRPAFSAYYSGTPVTATGSFQKITLNTEEYDTNSNFDSTTNYRFTPTVSGKYMLLGSVYCQGSTSLTNVALAIYKNGAIYKRGQWQTAFTAGGFQTFSVNALVDANGSTDYFELFAVIVGTGTVDYRAGIEALDTSFQGMRIF